MVHRYISFGLLSSNHIGLVKHVGVFFILQLIVVVQLVYATLWHTSLTAPP